ncbi:mechanosensitive ion channel protein 2, chloroplastic-like [Nymphaea colorata]|nr:mechanosensitive ion channel protein 2, chloroplastic-like [Nymphaea colorata]XP_031483612.1 mechanosensitive ion channel protein 2, chloroplastic-like [Nymphaea colorata]XP_031483613.1 mechanosensitive ion channel protein 2, chloroplastic-like [Nymphaea colorata]XP_031483615.1 mechanosensitive ion channel protein 2, chloroplastic-like [Nymphaea colorata]
MATNCLLQLSYYNICNNHGCPAKFRGLVGNQRRSSLSFPSSLSSISSITGAWCLHLSHQIHHPVRVVSSTYSPFTCRSFFFHCRGLETPICKATGLAFSWSCNTSSGRPILFQLVPAVGVIVFALWGLKPVVRFVHFFFFRCDVDDWRKSRTNYIVTSYLQPLMLWTGAVLSCRILDLITLPTEAGQSMKQRILIFIQSLSTVLAFSYCLSSLIHQTQKFFMERNDSDIAQNMGFQFAGKAVGTAVWIAAASLFMELLGFSTQKWLTAGGLGTVLLTLAGREILTNFLSSVMIHATRPFLVNEWIQTKIQGYEVSGFVEHVGWWSPTIIRGEDGEAIHIPNHKFTVSVVRNLSQKTHWRIKTHLAISHLDVNKINNIVAHMRKVLAKNPHVEQQRLHRRVFLESINPENQALLILVSCFVKTSHFDEYLCVKEAILLDLLRVISHHRARLATPIRTVQKFYGDTDIENVPFSETIMNWAGVNRNRHLLLIDSTSKFGVDDKARARTARSNEEIDVKPLSSESKATSSECGSQAIQGSRNRKDSDKIDGPPVTNSSSVSISEQAKTTAGGLDSTVSNPIDGEHLGPASDMSTMPDSKSAAEKVGGNTTSSLHGKLEGEKTSGPPGPTARSALEENIVLGVALDGSKRILPIEEEDIEQRKLTASRSGDVSPVKKDERQMPATPGAAAADLKEQDR